MHRAYQPLKPSTNKYIQQKWDQSNYEQHRRKVSTAVPVVDTKGIRTPAHMALKLKKRQLEQERLTIIERDNQLLSSKLADIMCSKGYVDDRNDYPERSLNAARRMEQMRLVTHQNQAILQRIRSQQSEYRRRNWEEHWEQAECRRDDIARYPRGLTNQQRPRRKVLLGARERRDTSTESASRQLSSETSGGMSSRTQSELAESPSP
ncbi:sperm axonemal maintenance protein CFAP97D1 isoform X1 [Paramormyrops kingsleyae]|uniref:sperm axonemal maintenance protein CFAP97D1 isoform X1 n=1 Tax=Paramormyrops kingsleyae TaxID=1676925 RepID=UPI003B96F571